MRIWCSSYRVPATSAAGTACSIRASEHQVSECWSGADSAACEGTCTYTRHDGSTITLPFVDVLHFRGEKAAKYCIYMDVGPLYGK